MKRLTLAALLLAGTALATLPAQADIADVTLGGFNWSFNGVNTLTLTNAVPAGNQVKNLPCVICGENQPLQPAGRAVQARRPGEFWVRCSAQHRGQAQATMNRTRTDRGAGDRPGSRSSVAGSCRQVIMTGQFGVSGAFIPGP